MPKMLKLLLILLLAAALIAIGIFAALRLMRLHRFKSGSLESCAYSYGGGMLGGREAVSVRRDAKTGVVTLETASRKTHADPEIKTTWQVDEACLDELKRLILEYRLYNAEGRPRGPQVMDGDTGSLSCWFDNNESFNFGTYQRLSAKEQEGLEKLTAYMYSLADAPGTSEPVSETEPHVLVLNINGFQLPYNMNECSASEGLLSELAENNGSRAYTFSRYSDNEMIFYPETKLDVSDAPPAEGGLAGTLCYYEPFGDVVFFYKDFQPAEGLYELGALDRVTRSALDLIEGMEPGEYYVSQRQ